MERCETCKNWDIEKAENPYYGECHQVTVAGFAVNVKQRMQCEEPFIMDIKPLITDKSYEFIEDIALYTHKDHCCKCWEKKAV